MAPGSLATVDRTCSVESSSQRTTTEAGSSMFWQSREELASSLRPRTRRWNTSLVPELASLLISRTGWSRLGTSSFQLVISPR